MLTRRRELADLLWNLGYQEDQLREQDPDIRPSDPRLSDISKERLRLTIERESMDRREKMTRAALTGLLSAGTIGTLARAGNSANVVIRTMGDSACDFADAAIANLDKTIPATEHIWAELDAQGTWATVGDRRIEILPGDYYIRCAGGYEGRAVYDGYGGWFDDRSLECDSDFVLNPHLGPIPREP